MNKIVQVKCYSKRQKIIDQVINVNKNTWKKRQNKTYIEGFLLFPSNNFHAKYPDNILNKR